MFHIYLSRRIASPDNIPAIKELRERVELLPPGDQIQDKSDYNLVKFLRGKKYNMEKTLKVVTKRVLFHRQYPELVEVL